MPIQVYEITQEEIDEWAGDNPDFDWLAGWYWTRRATSLCYLEDVFKVRYSAEAGPVRAHVFGPFDSEEEARRAVNEGDRGIE